MYTLSTSVQSLIAQCISDFSRTEYVQFFIFYFFLDNRKRLLLKAAPRESDTWQ